MRTAQRLLFLLFLTLPLLRAQAPEVSPPEDARQLGYVDATVLGLVEGITEYLPVSSTGHLLLTNRFLGLNAGKDEAGLKLADAADAYAIVIQGGAILAVIILYWRRLLSICMGLVGRDPNGLRLGLNLIVAFLPAAVFGLLLDDWIEETFFKPIPILIALVAGAVLMFGVEKWRAKRQPDEGDSLLSATDGPELHHLKLSQCLTIGLLQCVAMWPGTSRSMMTIVGGYLAGLSPKRAAEFSFLLGLITLGAATCYKLLTDWHVMTESLAPGPAVFGVIVATVSAALAVKWLVGFLSKHGLAPFAWYRIGLAIVVALVLFL